MTRSPVFLLTSLCLSALLGGCARDANIITPVPRYSLEMNTASESRIAEFAGLGPVIAADIVAQRTTRRFTSCGDFAFRVRGVGPFSLRKLSDQGMMVNGEIC